MGIFPDAQGQLSAVIGPIWPNFELVRDVMDANLQKTTFYKTNVDLVNDDVYTKFGLILSIRSQDIELNPNSDINQGP